MSDIIEPIRALAVQLSKLPGIGSKTAQRLAFHVVGMSESQAQALACAITEAKARIRFCSVCGAFTENDPCALCVSPRRTGNILCVVREPRDVYVLENTREFNGLYHVLGGVISPMDGVGPENLRISELVDRVKAGGIDEVILATSLDIESEATAHYLLRQLKPYGVTVSRIAHGVPVGGHLEFTDERTLIKALEGRREMS